MIKICLSVIKATPELTEAISRICSEGWKQTVQGLYDEAYQRKNINYWYNYDKVLEDIEKGSYTHVTIVDKKVVGTIGGVISKEGISEIYVFYIDEDYRYQGIGSKLLEIFTKEHVSKGATKQVVSVEQKNKYGLPFYLARGFRQGEEDKRFWRAIN